MAIGGELDEIFRQRQMGGMHEIPEWDQYRMNDATREIMLKALSSRAGLYEVLEAIDPHPELNTVSSVDTGEAEASIAS